MSCQVTAFINLGSVKRHTGAHLDGLVEESNIGNEFSRSRIPYEAAGKRFNRRRIDLCLLAVGNQIFIDKVADGKKIGFIRYRIIFQRLIINIENIPFTVCAAVYFTLNQVLCLIAFNIGRKARDILTDDKVILTFAVEAYIAEGDDSSHIFHLCQILDKYIIRSCTADAGYNLIVLIVSQFIAYFLQDKGIPLARAGFLIVDLLIQINLTLETNKGTALIRIQMALCGFAHIGIVPDHRAAVVSSLNSDQRLGSNHMTKLTSARTINRSGTVWIVVNN